MIDLTLNVGQQNNINMKLFDTHCHINDKAFNKDIDTVINRAREAEVTGLMVVGIVEKTSEKAIAVAEKYPGVYASVGIHPHDAKACSQAVLERLKKLAKNPNVKAWGETGLDFNRMFSPKEIQEKWFIRQVEIAGELDLPLIFHERDSGGRFLDILKATHTPRQRGVVHCFSGNEAELSAYLDLGLYIGITGVLTIKSRGADLRELVKSIPSDRLVVETDAPYLTPTPDRNKVKRNEPAFVRTTFLKLAEVRGEAPELLSKIVWENSCRLFGIDN